MAVDLKTHIAYMSELNSRLVGGDIVDLAILPPARTLLVSIKKRVVNEGRSSDNSKMRPYSTTPIYVNRSQFVKGGFNPQGKNHIEGNTIGDRLVPTVRLNKNGVKRNPVKYASYTLVKPNLQRRKSMYLANGYKELRDIQGLRTDVTNMKYSGKMINDYQLEKVGESVIMGLTTQQSALKYRGLSDGTRRMAGRGAFLKASPEELKVFLTESTFLIARLTRNIINGLDLTATID